MELNLLNLARALQERGYIVHIVAPSGSRTVEVPLVWQAEGLPPAFAQGESRDSPVVLSQPSVLANLWEGARALQSQYDLIVNWGYDWLPLYLTPFFQTPIFHVISMGSLLDHIDAAISQIVFNFPGTVAVHSHAQAETFVGIEDLVILPCGMDLSAYQFCPQPENYLAWIGRIAPEKGLEDALAAAALAKLPLYVLGRLQDPDYFAQIQAENPEAILKYCGFLPTDEMQSILGKARALLVTPKWIEAFGNVVVEALACGVPVIAYHRGGPAETVLDGITGFLTPPDDPASLAAAIAKLDTIDRKRCRIHAEENYTLSAMADRFETWFRKLDKTQKSI